MKDRIKALRKSLGITQAKFAEDLGVSLMAVQKWEMGHNNPSGAMIQLLASKYLRNGSERETARCTRRNPANRN